MAAPAGATWLPQAEREAINRTLDRFVDSAVKRHDVAASWNLVTPEMRAGVSRSAWNKGNLPVIPYPAGGTTFHDWTIDSASATEVDFELMLPSEKSKSDSIQFNGTMRKQQGSWLVDSFNPSATIVGGILCVLGFFAFVWLRTRRAYRRANLRPLEPIVVKRRGSEPPLVAKER